MLFAQAKNESCESVKCVSRPLLAKKSYYVVILIKTDV